MLDSIPQDQKDIAATLIRQKSLELGVPQDRVRRILYWHSHRSKCPIASLEILKAWLEEMPGIIRAYNQVITLQQLRRQGSANTTITAEE
jgi:hypothetical protein